MQYGAPAKPQNFNIYRHLATEILLEEQKDANSYVGLRNIFHKLVLKLVLFHVFLLLDKFLFIFDTYMILQVVEVTSPSVGAEFDRFLNVFHLLIISFTCQTVIGLEVIAAKVK